MEICLPDGAKQELPEGSSVVDLSRKLKKSLIGSALAAIVNGEPKDITTQLNDGDTVQVLTFESETGKALFWHSSAHLMAQAIMRLFPDAQPTIGPAIDNGFYYDFANLSISENDFPRIEEEMKKIVQERFRGRSFEPFWAESF